MKKKSWIFRLFGLIILGIIIYKTDLHRYFALFKEIRLINLIYASLIILIIYIFKSFRWRLLLKSQKISYSYKNSLLAFTASNFIAFITPGRIGEFAKILYLKNDTGASLSKTLPSVLTDRLFDVYILLFFGISGLFYFQIGNNPWLYLFILACIGFPLLLFNKNLYNLFFKILNIIPFLSVFIQRKAGGIENMRKEFQSLININLLYALIISVFSYILLYYSAFLLALAINIDLKFSDVVLIVSSANILSFLPITVSGLGTREAVFIYFLSGFGYNTEQSLLLSTLFFICFYIVGGLYGYICYMIKPVNIRYIKKEIK